MYFSTEGSQCDQSISLFNRSVLQTCSKRGSPNVDATTAGGKSIGSAPALVLVVYVAVCIVVVVVVAIALVPKRPPVPEYGFLVDPAAGAIFVSGIVVRVVVVGVTKFGGRVVHPCWIVLILLLLLLPRLGHATLRQHRRLGDLLCGGIDGHVAEGVGTDPAIFGDGAQFVGRHLSEVRQMQRQRRRQRLQLQRWIIRRSSGGGDFVPVVIDRDWRRQRERRR